MFQELTKTRVALKPLHPAVFSQLHLSHVLAGTCACHSCTGVMLIFTYLYSDITGSDSTGYILSPHLGETETSV